MNLSFDEHLEILRRLLAHNVDFMIIGGYAVIHHGYSRTTGDMDIWLKPDNDNKERLIAALTDVGFDDDGLQAVKAFDFTMHHIFSLSIEPQPVEFLTHISGIDYTTAAKQISSFPMDDISVPFIHLNHLVLSKMSTGRAKDKADVEELQKLMKKRY